MHLREHRHGHQRTAGLLAALLLTLALGACSVGSSENSAADSAASQDGGETSGGSVAATAPDADGLSVDADSSRSSAAFLAERPGVKNAAITEPAIIAKGTVSLHADDVARARFEIQRLTDTVGGQISSEETEADKSSGEITRLRMVLRVPSKTFTKVVDDLQDVGELESSSTSSKDVTTQVLDVASRVQVQQASIRRIRVLLARAQSIRDIVSIESELSSRQADLESLQRQQAYLASQTSMSTINVYVDRTAKPTTKKDDHGFLAGLASGWHGLTTTTVGLLTATGAVLPFAIVLLALGLVLVPVRRLARRLRSAGRTARTPSDA